MGNKVYTEERLARLIGIANLYIEEPDIRKGMVSKLHQEIGHLSTGADPKSAIDMSQREVKSLKAALLRWQKEKSNPTALDPR